MGDDLIKIINGGHVEELDDEEMGNGISDLWDELIKYLNGKGKVGKFFAQVMEKYKDRVVAMIKKLMASQGEGLIKIIEKIKDDLIKIINGGHVEVELNRRVENWQRKWMLSRRA